MRVGQILSHHEMQPLLASDSLTNHLLEGRTATENYANISFRGPNGTVGPRDINTHHLHWYPAKMFHRIPAAILEALRLPPGSTVLDPFCGSGTVLVEALSHNCSAIGMDLHPLARMISRAKTTPLNHKAVRSHLTVILQKARSLRRHAPEGRLPQYWFRDPARKALYRLFCAIDVAVNERPYRDFFFANLTNITRRCSMADPAIPPPVRMRSERVAQGWAKIQTRDTSRINA